MPENLRDPKDHRPAPCPDCGGEQRVSGWACVDLDGGPGFEPTRVSCVDRCKDPTTSELAAV